MKSVINPKRIAIIAGETSGDHHGALVVSAVAEQHEGIYFFGIGGPALREAGVRILVDAAELSVVGITEVMSRLPRILRGMKIFKQALKRMKPDLLILIDFPDFNLRMAAYAKKIGIPVLYYISPQIWAWRPGRVKKIKRIVDHMAVILPFEEAFYRKYNVPVTFVGHPLLDTDLPQRQLNGSKSDSAGEGPSIGFLPGSRDSEVNKHLPVMLDCARILKDRLKRAKFLISHAPSVDREYVDDILKGYADLPELEIISGKIESVFAQSDLLVAASGTVTLQAAMHGVPMIIMYKVSPISYWLGRALIRVSNIGLVNLVAEKNLAPELIQDQASAENIAEKVIEMLADPEKLNTLKNELLSVRDRLGGAGASRRVADIAVNLLQR